MRRWADVLATAIAVQLAIASAAIAAEIGRVVRTNGAPAVVRAGKSEALAAGAAVFAGDRVTTDAAAKIKILLNDDSVLAIGPGSQVVLNELLLNGGGRTGRLEVLIGRFKIAIADWLSGPSDYEVRMPTAVAGVRGTVLWGDTELDAICALRGTVEVRTAEGANIATLETGRCVGNMGRGTPAPLVPSPAELQKYLAEVTLD